MVGGGRRLAPSRSWTLTSFGRSKRGGIFASERSTDRRLGSPALFWWAPWSPSASSPRRRTTRCLRPRPRHKRSVEPSLSVLPAAHEQASALGAATATTLEQTMPPNLRPAVAELALPPAPAATVVEPVTAEAPQQAPAPASEIVSQIVAATELRSAKVAGDILPASPAAEKLTAPQYGTVIGALAEPATLALASAKLTPLRQRQSAVPEFRTRTPKIPMLALRKPLRPNIVMEARAIVPAIRALDGPEPPVQISQQKGTPAGKQADPAAPPRAPSR